MLICFHPDRRDGLHAAGTGAAGDPLVDVLGTAELCLHGCAIDQVAFQRQRADDGGVAREAAARLHLFLGIGVAVVQREVQDRLAGVRRDGDEDALCRVTAVEHEAVLRAGPDACAQALGAGHLCRLDPRRHRLRARASARASTSGSAARPSAPLRHQPRTPPRPGPAPSASAWRQYIGASPRPVRRFNATRCSTRAARRSPSSRAGR